jgi:hypothetical protein
MAPNEPIHSRDSDGISVDLYWNPKDPENEFRVEVTDHRTDADFTIYPQTGKEALHAFNHPFVAAHNALKSGRVAA